MKSILVLTDFSLQANYVAEFAINLAITNRSDLTFCHVIGIDGIPEHTTWNERTCDLREKLFKFKKIAKENPGSISFRPKINCITKFGTFSETAEKMVFNKSVDLVIIGSRHTTCVSRFQFGSHAYSLPDKIKCPVLLIPKGLKFEGIRMITYATDLPKNNRKALEFLGDLAKPFNAAVTVSDISRKVLPVKITDYAVKSLLIQQGKTNDQLEASPNTKHYNLNTRLLNIRNDNQVSILALVYQKYQFLEGLFHESLSKILPTRSAIPLLILPNSFLSENIS